MILSWAMWSLFIYNGAHPHLVRLFLGNTPRLCPYLNYCKTWGASVCHSRRQEWDCPNYWDFERRGVSILKTLGELSEAELRVLEEYTQDPSGSGDEMSAWLTQMELWPAFNSLRNKLEVKS